MGLDTFLWAEKMPEGKDDETSRKQLWRPVDPKIWEPGPPPRMLKRITGRIGGLFAPFFLASMVVVGPLSILISLLVVYSLVPGEFFGLTLVALWSVVIVAFVLVVEKTGYARNFEDWNFPLRRIVAVPIAFLLVLSVLLLLYFLAHPKIL